MSETDQNSKQGADSRSPRKLKHHKLTPVVDSNLPRFSLRLRYPGWRPDEVEDVELGELDPLYVEEVLGAYKKDSGEVVRQPFQPPLTDSSGSNWVFGHPLKAEVKTDFDHWLQDLSVAARRYNGGLYRLRRLHLI